MMAIRLHFECFTRYSVIEIRTVHTFERVVHVPHIHTCLKCM